MHVRWGCMGTSSLLFSFFPRACADSRLSPTGQGLSCEWSGACLYSPPAVSLLSRKHARSGFASFALSCLSFRSSLKLNILKKGRPPHQLLLNEIRDRKRIFFCSSSHAVTLHVDDTLPLHRIPYRVVPLRLLFKIDGQVELGVGEER